MGKCEGLGSTLAECTWWAINACICLGKQAVWVFKMTPAVIPTWVFPCSVPSPPFFLLLLSLQHCTVQVQQY